MKRRNKKKNTYYRAIVIFGLNLVLLCLFVIYTYGVFVNGKDNDKAILNKKNKDNKVILEDKSYKISMIMAGDNLIHSSVYKDARERNKGQGFDFGSMYELLKPIVSSYDLAYYNQETILGGEELGLSDYPVFNSPYEVGDTMLDLGFNLVSLATNHTMDRGEKAVLNSRNYWNSKSDVLAVGSYSSLEERDKVQIKEANNISYTMLNYAYGTNGMPIPTGKDYLINVWPTDLSINDPSRDTLYQEYKKQVKKDIDSVRDKVDVLIVAMHWGVEYVIEPTSYQKDMAKYLASLGVDIIIGTHAHVIEPIEWIDNTLVIYSLGNLISAQYQNESPCNDYRCVVGLLSSVDITKNVSNGKSSIKIDNLSNELVYNYFNQSKWRGFRVIPFSNSEISKYLSNYKNIYNKYSDVVRKFDSTIKVNDVYEG